jgi:hypothetical protein
MPKKLSFTKFKEEALKDETFKIAYEALRPEFENLLTPTSMLSRTADSKPTCKPKHS